MTFNELWEQVAELKALPCEAVRLVPDSLTQKTKKKLCKKKTDEVSEIILWAIEQINCGSTETVDALVNQIL